MKSVVAALLSALDIEQPQLDGLLCAARSVGIDTESLVADLEGVVRERIFMWLVSHVDDSFTYRERKSLVERRLTANATHLSSLPVEAREELVNAIASAQSRIAKARTELKTGLRHIYLVESDALLSEQGYRCAACGVPLSHRVRRSCDRFPEGVEPLESPVLDHVDPFYLGGNAGNYQLLCGRCNALKNDFAGVQEDGIVLSGNFLRNRLGEQTRRRMIFWTLCSCDKCVAGSCDRTAKESMLWVAKTRHTVPFTYGNLDVFCTEHAPASAKTVHDDEMLIDR
jgi:hypothetical protein